MKVLDIVIKKNIVEVYHAFQSISYVFCPIMLKRSGCADKKAHIDRIQF